MFTKSSATSSATKNTKYFWNTVEEKLVAPLRIINLFIKVFAIPFVDIVWNFSDNLLNLFSTSTFLFYLK